MLRRHTLTLVGVQNASPAQVEAAALAGLASFAPNSTQPSRRRAVRTAGRPLSRRPGREAAAKTRARDPAGALGDADLRARRRSVVTAAVSPGAEIMADGNIHVYGALRGRALAGAGGDAEARIFCSRFEAELVSIAGHYLVSEQMPAEERGFPVQIALVDDRLTITRN